MSEPGVGDHIDNGIESVVYLDWVAYKVIAEPQIDSQVWACFPIVLNVPSERNLPKRTDSIGFACPGPRECNRFAREEGVRRRRTARTKSVSAINEQSAGEYVAERGGLSTANGNAGSNGMRLVFPEY